MSYVLVSSALNIDVTFVKSAKRSLVSGFNGDLSQKAPFSPPSRHHKLDRVKKQKDKTVRLNAAQVMFAL